MRAFLRISVSAVAGFLLVLAGGLSVFTAEIVADEIGYAAAIRRFIRNGWQAMNSAGYVEWIFVAGIFFAGAAVALWLDYLIRPKNPFKGTKNRIERMIDGQYFRNENVPLDGVRYTNCRFENVKFIYNGGKVALEGSDLSEIVIKTDIQEIRNFVVLLNEFGFLSVAAYDRSGIVSPSGNTFITTEDEDVHPQSPPDTPAKTQP